MKKEKQKEKPEKKKKKPFPPPKPEKEKKKEIKRKGNKPRNPFIELDRGGNIFTNFFSNFLRQFKKPTQTGLGRLLAKLVVVKIGEKENKPEKKTESRPEKPVDIMGPVKTVFRFVSNSANELTPSEKESLRQRQNQPLKNNVRPDEPLEKPAKKGLRM